MIDSLATRIMSGSAGIPKGLAIADANLLENGDFSLNAAIFYYRAKREPLSVKFSTANGR